jgi:hypothetical protein
MTEPCTQTACMNDQSLMNDPRMSNNEDSSIDMLSTNSEQPMTRVETCINYAIWFIAWCMFVLVVVGGLNTLAKGGDPTVRRWSLEPIETKVQETHQEPKAMEPDESELEIQSLKIQLNDLQEKNEQLNKEKEQQAKKSKVSAPPPPNFPKADPGNSDTRPWADYYTFGDGCAPCRALEAESKLPGFPARLNKILCTAETGRVSPSGMYPCIRWRATDGNDRTLTGWGQETRNSFYTWFPRTARPATQQVATPENFGSNVPNLAQQFLGSSGTFVLQPVTPITATMPDGTVLKYPVLQGRYGFPNGVPTITLTSPLPTGSTKYKGVNLGFTMLPDIYYLDTDPPKLDVGGKSGPFTKRVQINIEEVPE